MTGTVFALDDDFLNLSLVKRFLEPLGVSVHTEQNALAAIERILAHPPDLLLLDCVMPVMSGREVVERLRREAATRELPILLLTGVAQEEGAWRGLDVQGILYKPFQPEELRRRVRAVMAHAPRPAPPQLERLERTPLPAILRGIYREAETGVLQLRRGESLVLLFFRNGGIVGGTSNAREMRFGEYLVGRGRLAPEQMTEIVAGLVPEKSFGDVLVDRGLMTRAEVDQQLEQLLRLILRDAMGWEDGTSLFQAAEEPLGARRHLGIAMPGLVCEALRGVDSRELLLHALGGPERVIQRVRLRQESFPAFTPSEYFVLSRLDRPRSVREVLQITPDTLLTLRTLATLYALDLLMIESEDATDFELEPAEAGDQQSMLRDQVTGLAQRIDSMHPHEILGLAPHAGPPEIRRRYDELRSFYENTDWPRDLDRLVARILDRLKRATASLVGRSPSGAVPLPRRPLPPPAAGEAPDFGAGRAKQQKLAQENLDKARQLIADGDPYTAVLLLEQAIVFDPDRAEYALLLGQVQMRHLRSRPSASQNFQRALRLDPALTEAWLGLASIYREEGLLQRAASCFSEALRCEPDNHEARAGLAQLGG